jgi:hypothetical protein
MLVGGICIKCKFDKTDMSQRMDIGDGVYAEQRKVAGVGK